MSSSVLYECELLSTPILKSVTVDTPSEYLGMDGDDPVSAYKSACLASAARMGRTQKTEPNRKRGAHE